MEQQQQRDVRETDDANSPIPCYCESQPHTCTGTHTCQCRRNHANAQIHKQPCTDFHTAVALTFLFPPSFSLAPPPPLPLSPPRWLLPSHLACMFATFSTTVAAPWKTAAFACCIIGAASCFRPIVSIFGGEKGCMTGRSSLLKRQLEAETARVCARPRTHARKSVALRKLPGPQVLVPRDWACNRLLDSSSISRFPAKTKTCQFILPLPCRRG